MDFGWHFFVVILLAIGANVAILVWAVVWAATQSTSKRIFIAVLVPSVLLADLVLVFGLIFHERATREQRRRELKNLLATPKMARLYELHMRSHWRSSLATIVDLLCVGTAGLAAWGLAITHTPLLVWLQSLPLTMDRQSALKISMLLFVGAAAVLEYVLVPSLYGTTLGLRAARLVAVDPATGKPLEPSKVRPPHRGDYRRDAMPGILYVPRDQFPMEEDETPCLPDRPQIVS